MIVHFPDLQLDYFGTEEASIGKLSSVIAIPFVCMKRHEIPLFRGRTRRYNHNNTNAISNYHLRPRPRPP